MLKKALQEYSSLPCTFILGEKERWLLLSFFTYLILMYLAFRIDFDAKFVTIVTKKNGNMKLW
jgi:hypothetical protein